MHLLVAVAVAAKAIQSTLRCILALRSRATIGLFADWFLGWFGLAGAGLL